MRGREPAAARGRGVDGVVTNRWVYKDALNPVAELDSMGNVVAVFVYGTKAHVPELMKKNGKTYRLITDHTGSVRMVVDTADGTIVQRIDYNSFGEVLSDTNPGFQPFGFQGGLYDPATGLTRFGARDYDSTTGRWLSKDPIGMTGGLNQYVFCGNNPVNFIDPLGLDNLNPNSWGYGSVNNTVLSGVDSEGHTVGGGQLKGMVDTVVYGGAVEAGVFAGGYLAVQAWPTVAAAGPALYDRAQTAYYRAMTWAPGNWVLDYPNSAPVRATIGEYIYNVSPYASHYAKAFVPGPWGPFGSIKEAGYWFGGILTREFLDIVEKYDNTNCAK